MISRTVFIEASVSLEIDETKLTKELMDNYERYFYDLKENSDYDKFETQIDKHIANISWYILRGDEEFIEGYGKLSEFIKDNDVDYGVFDGMSYV